RPDVPIHCVQNHAVQSGVHPEAHDSLGLGRPFGRCPVVLRQMDGRAMRILARPARPVEALCALAPLPEFIFGWIVARSLRTNKEITIACDWRRRRWALAPEEES